jgi:predicted nucleic acid-binding protein
MEILDASVVVKWFIRDGERGLEAADEVLRRVLLEPDRFAAPVLLLHEMHAALCRRRERRQDVDDCVRSFFALDVQLVYPDEGLMTLATELAFSQRLSGYDAAYAALARHLKGRWLTFDEPAYERVATLGIACLLPLE